MTGTQMAHFTALAAARHKLLAERDWDVERHGLRGAPRLRVIVGDRRHDAIDRAVRMLGLGSDAIVSVRCDAGSRIDVAALRDALDADPECATVVASLEVTKDGQRLGIADCWRRRSPAASPVLESEPRRLPCRRADRARSRRRGSSRSTPP